MTLSSLAVLHGGGSSREITTHIRAQQQLRSISLSSSFLLVSVRHLWRHHHHLCCCCCCHHTRNNEQKSKKKKKTHLLASAGLTLDAPGFCDVLFIVLP